MKKHLTIRMEEDLIDKLKIKSIAEHTTITDVLTAMVEDYVKEVKSLKTVEMQYEQHGEWFPIWYTRELDLENVWKEMDNQPDEGGHIRFHGEDEFMVVNGGFDK